MKIEPFVDGNGTRKLCLATDDNRTVIVLDRDKAAAVARLLPWMRGESDAETSAPPW